MMSSIWDRGQDEKTVCKRILMNKHQMATVFVSHGAPTLPLEEIPARRFLADLGKKYRNIEAVLCISAHWATEGAAVTAAKDLETIHDFFGFPSKKLSNYCALSRAGSSIPGSFHAPLDNVRSCRNRCQRQDSPPQLAVGRSGHGSLRVRDLIHRSRRPPLRPISISFTLEARPRPYRYRHGGNIWHHEHRRVWPDVLSTSPRSYRRLWPFFGSHDEIQSQISDLAARPPIFPI